MTIQRDQRITDSHLKRKAIIYVRQSSARQVKLNTESLKFQLALRERAISFGWNDPFVIDDDLGISAGGYSERPGFQKMLTMVTIKEVGIILCVDASRLSRNSKDWAHLFELCGFFNTLVADYEQVFDINAPNDRMVLGIKGTMSELELSILKMRLKSGAIQKARRGELKFILPPGYCYDYNNFIVMDFDARIREAIHLMFIQFRRHTSIRQLTDWYITNNIHFPVRRVGRDNPIVWEAPKYGNLKTLLRNPIYAGVYAYGRSKTVYEYRDGSLIRKIIDNVPHDQWQVFIKDHHEAYISWEEFLDFQTKISQNRPRWKMDENLCAIRQGLALLVGLLRCGHCGGKLYVTYKTNKNLSAMYFCRGFNKAVPKKCLSFGAHFVDKAICEELLKALEPAAIEAGFKAVESAESHSNEKLKMAELEVQNAQYHAQRAFEQYDLVDPKNRLVASSLEERLNARLVDLKQAREKLSSLKQVESHLTEADKQTIIKLSQDFRKVWHHDKTDPASKKQLLRLFIKEIIVTHDAGLLHFVIHWQGGVHTRVSVKKRKTPIGNKANSTLIEKVRKLCQRIDDSEIARVLNMLGESTPTGLRWSKDRVAQFRKHHGIRAQRHKKDKSFTAEKAAEYLGISRRGLSKLVKTGLIDKNQVMSFAPWEISREQLDSEEVQRAVLNLRNTGRLFPDNGCSKDQMELFSIEQGTLKT